AFVWTLTGRGVAAPTCHRIDRARRTGVAASAAGAVVSAGHTDSRTATTTPGTGARPAEGEATATPGGVRPVTTTDPSTGPAAPPAGSAARWVGAGPGTRRPSSSRDARFSPPAYTESSRLSDRAPGFAPGSATRSSTASAPDAPGASAAGPLGRAAET